VQHSCHVVIAFGFDMVFQDREARFVIGHYSVPLPRRRCAAAVRNNIAQYRVKGCPDAQA
jgi:hypothetical protein